MSKGDAGQSAEQDRTILQQQKLFQDRWTGYGEHAGIKLFQGQPTVKDLKKLDIFKEYDDAFLQAISHDISIASWKKGAVLFEEGSYLDLAFYVVSGEVEVYVDKLRQQSHQPIFNATHLAQSISSEEMSERLKPRPAQAYAKPNKGAAAQNMTFLSSMDFDLPHGESMQLGQGDIFGEIGTLNGWPQSVTAQLASEATLVHIRLAALREMRKKSSGLKDRLDALYRTRTLKTQLATTPLFKYVEKPFLDKLAAQVELVSYAPGDEIVAEGAPADALYLVRSGFIKLLQTIGEKQLTVSYLSKGMTLGEIGLLIDGIDTMQYTGISVGYTELVKISRKDFDALVEKQPTVARQLWDFAVASIKDAGHTQKHLNKADLIDFSLQKGLVQGNSMLVIDLDVCTRCDDCVTGCSNTHEGRPRFVREGEKYDNFLIARSCYHCEDPVCLIGCPTGAIKRTNVGEVVAIEDELCIGCGNCANKCPYDAIVMHDTEEKWSDDAFPKWLRGRDRKVASKCDLCYTSDTGPACVNSCPHSCAFRVASLDDFQALLTTRQADA